MKDLIARLFESRYPARYIGRHRAPGIVLMLSSVRHSRTTESARVTEATV